MKKTSNILCIMNGHASKGQAVRKTDRIKEAFARRKQNIDLVMTGQRRQAILLASQGAEAGYDIIVAAGGDGTVNEVANGIMLSGKKVAFGILPIGRGNDFAYSAGIPADLDKAVDLILTTAARPIDVGLLYGGNALEGRYFLNGAGFGFEPEVNFRASSYRNVNGFASYLLAFLHSFCFLPRPYDMTLTVDGSDINLKTQQVSVCNGRRMGAAFIMGPEAVMNDGLLDVVYANRPLKRLKITTVALRFFSGTQLKTSVMTMKRASEHVIIRTMRPEMKIHVDGEEISRDADYCRIELIENGLRLFCAAGVAVK
ncbi:MAG: diacylglycerol/lipid kinase family protein [Bullifex sp.]